MKKIVVAALGLAALCVVLNADSAEAGICRTGFGYGANYGGFVGVGVVAPRYNCNYPVGYGGYYGGGYNRGCAPIAPRCAPVAPCAPAPRCITPAYYGPRRCAPVIAPGCRPCGLGY